MKLKTTKCFQIHLVEKKREQTFQPAQRASILFGFALVFLRKVMPCSRAQPSVPCPVSPPLSTLVKASLPTRPRGLPPLSSWESFVRRHPWSAVECPVLPAQGLGTVSAQRDLRGEPRVRLSRPERF